jgi:CO/xanthine dehydrogenase FAD-binding subunit
MPDLAFQTPATLEELTSCLRLAGPDTYLLGGGTDLVIRLRDRGVARGTLIDLTGVAGLDRVQAAGAWIHVGANVTYAQLADHPLVRADLPCLAQMAEQVGSAQIRNMARLPGNLANASPGGDAIPCLLALQAQVEILDGTGAAAWRTVPELVTGIGRTTLRPGEAIIGVRIPRPGRLQRSAYGKMGMGARTRVVIANLSLTLVLEYDPAPGRILDARVALGSAAPVAFRSTVAEALLQGAAPTPALARDLAEALRGDVQASIGAVAIFQHKLNDVRGLALDLFEQLFAGEC